MHVLAFRMPEILTIYLFISGQLIIGADAQDIYQHLSHYGNKKNREFVRCTYWGFYAT